MISKSLIKSSLKKFKIEKNTICMFVMFHSTHMMIDTQVLRRMRSFWAFRRTPHTKIGSSAALTITSASSVSSPYNTSPKSKRLPENDKFTIYLSFIKYQKY